MRYIYIVLVLLIFQGCATKVVTVNKKNSSLSKNYAQAKQNPKTISKQEESSAFYHIESQTLKKEALLNAKNKIFTGSIRGRIQQLTYDKKRKSWLYVIISRDTANYKLPYARFYHGKKLANRGDLVYVILNNSILQDLFFIKKANRAQKNHKIYKKKKKRKKRQFSEKGRVAPNISLPEVENITF